MSRRFLFLIAILLAATGPAAAQSANGNDIHAQRTVAAVRLEAHAPAVNGRLDEAAWSQAEPAGEFIQREPAEGQPAPEATEVRFLYTSDALYIGARMFSANPTGVRALVARRDRDVPSEQLLVSLDTRGDRRTAYTFAITPGGVRTDYYHNSD